MTQINQDPTKRFSNRVNNYEKHRPGYPLKLIEELVEKLKISESSVIADIGSGTGIFTHYLLKYNCSVFAVEPNTKMRSVAEKNLSPYPNFKSINGKAENTHLEENSIDLITVAQAFHWFELEQTKQEFTRILKPEGKIAIIWNERDLVHDPLQRDYEQLLIDYCPGYLNAVHRNISESQISQYISDFSYFTTKYEQEFDYPSLEGRLFSSSYTPLPDSSQAIPLKDNLKTIFQKYAKDGKIIFSYNSQMYYGLLNQN